MKAKILTMLKAWSVRILLGVILLSTAAYFLLSGEETTQDYLLLGNVEQGDLTLSISESGQVSDEEDIELTPEASAKVTAVYVDEGSYVKAGQILLSLDAADASFEVEDAEISLEQAQLDLEELGEPGDEIDVKRAENDVTEAKNAITELGADYKTNTADLLEKMELVRRDLVSNVAHELATPLTNISGYLRAINDGTIEYGDEMKETLMLLESETDRLSNLVGDVRALYWVDSPKKELELQETDLNKLIHEIVKNMRPKFESKSLKLELNLEEDVPTVELDRDKFIQVAMNLLANAIAYTSEAGHIAVSTGIKDDEVVVLVKDDGIGISEEDIPYIFERFYRVDKSRSRKTGGTGVGLTIVKDLVEAHGGRIELKSELGKGSEFFVYFPLGLQAN